MNVIFYVNIYPYKDNYTRGSLVSKAKTGIRTYYKIKHCQYTKSGQKVAGLPLKLYHVIAANSEGVCKAPLALPPFLRHVPVQMFKMVETHKHWV